MKKFLLSLVVAIATMCFAPQHAEAAALCASEKALIVSYKCEYKIPKSIYTTIENPQIREQAISAIKAKGGVYNLFVKGKIIAFTTDNNDTNEKFVKINGDLSSYIDMSTGVFVLNKQIADKNFVVEEPYVKPLWVISSEKKNIAGKLCVKATQNENGITAWFCPEIPSQGGPIGITGLPGLILAIETETYTAEVRAVEFVDSSLVNIKKPEGKKISGEDFEKLKMKKMKELGISTDLKPGEVKVISTRIE